LSSSTLYGRWIENSSGTLSVKAAVYDTRGLKAPEEITVSGLLSRVLSQGSMVPSGSGSAFLAWEDFNPQLKTPFTAIAETGPGGLRWKKVLGNNAAGAEYMAPAITGDGAGGVFAAARHIHNGDKGIVLNHFSQRGAALAEDVQANTFLGYQSGPVISPDGQGGVFLIWEDGRSGDIDIYGQRISSGGIPAWAAAGVPIVTADGNQWSPVLAPDGAGGFFCAWIDDDMGMKWQLKVQRLDKDGRPLWGQAGLTVYPSDRRQSDLSMAADGKGGVILSWNEPRSGYLAVFAQRFATDGSRLWQEGGVPVAEDNWDQAAPIMAPDGKGGCLLAWKSRRSDLTWAVSAQRLDSKGAPLWKAGTERR
jgi:hypothetical protein